jgi:ubiquinone biosynthesis protein
MARHLGPGLTADVGMFRDLFRLVTRYGVTVPPELAAVFRAPATVEGAFAAAHLHETMLPESLRATVLAELVRLLPPARRLPRRLDRITSALEHGRLSTGVRPFADDRDRQVVTRLVHQSLLTVLAAATGVTAAILLGTGGGPQVAPELSLYELIAYSLLLLSGALTLRLLTSILRS